MPRGDVLLCAVQIVLDDLDIESITPQKLSDLMNIHRSKAGVLLKDLGWTKCGNNNCRSWERRGTLKVFNNFTEFWGRKKVQRILMDH